jgi:hypothetical protein
VRLMSSRSTRRTKPWGPSARCWPAACRGAELPGSSLMSYASSGRDTEGPNSSSARACACPSNRRPDSAARTAPAASRNCRGGRRQDNTTRCKPDSTARCSPWLSSSPAESSCGLYRVSAGRLRRQLSAARHTFKKHTSPSSLVQFYQFSANLCTSRRSLKGAGHSASMKSRCLNTACKTIANASGGGVDGTLMGIVSCAQASLALAVRACARPLLAAFCVYPCMLGGTQRMYCCPPPSLEGSSACKTPRRVPSWVDRLACLGSQSVMARCFIALPRITAGRAAVALLVHF